jgi:hypothetical protein
LVRAAEGTRKAHLLNLNTITIEMSLKFIVKET